MLKMKVGEDGLCPNCGTDLSVPEAVACSDFVAIVVPGAYRGGRVELDLTRQGSPQLRYGVDRDVYCVRCSQELDAWVVRDDRP